MIGRPASSTLRPNLDEMLSRLEDLVVDCARYGNSDIAINIQIVGSGRRLVIIKAGKNLRYYIPPEELES